jgi:tetratricopeptide (TPR) repeat protein
MNHKGPIKAIAFSPDGKMVATASDDKMAQLWNAATGQPIGRPMRHLAAVNSVVFTPDGGTLVTGSDDRTIRYWRVPTPLPGEAPKIRMWAELSTGRALNPEGIVGELSPGSWEAAREGLASRERQLPGSAQENLPLELANPFVAAAGHGLTYHLQQTLACVEEKDWPAASWHLHHEISAQPDSWPAYVLRTKVEVELGQHEAAAADLAKAFELGPPERVLSWYRSYAAESAAKPQGKDALWYLDKLIAAQPREAVLFVDRANVYLKKKQWRDAAKDFEKAVELSPNNPQIWTEKGNVDLEHGRWQEAAKAWAKFLKLDPSDYWEWCHSSTLLLHLEDEKGCRRQCQEMLARFGQTTDPVVAERMAKACMLTPVPPADQELVQKLAQTGGLRKGSEGRPQSQCVIGAKSWPGIVRIFPPSLRPRAGARRGRTPSGGRPSAPIARAPPRFRGGSAQRSTGV